MVVIHGETAAAALGRLGSLRPGPVPKAALDRGETERPRVPGAGMSKGCANR